MEGRRQVGDMITAQNKNLLNVKSSKMSIYKNQIKITQSNKQISCLADSPYKLQAERKPSVDSNSNPHEKKTTIKKKKKKRKKEIV